MTVDQFKRLHTAGQLMFVELARINGNACDDKITNAMMAWNNAIASVGDCIPSCGCRIEFTNNNTPEAVYCQPHAQKWLDARKKSVNDY